ncbi:MAG: hypothetical protein K0Q59_2234 [Paenibacillus sp.]|nr:hypothetical protein [Paenibacillus sp.]
MSAALCMALLPACSGSGSSSSSSDKPANSDKPATTAEALTPAQTGPAELTILSKVASITQEEFERTMAAPIKVTGNPPDIIITSIAGMFSGIIPFQLQYDISELVKKYKYDLNRLEPSNIQSLRDASGTGALYGLPKYTNGVTLFYNKDIFDKFGVAYPKNGMTWDDALKLATQMTRTSDGIKYRGMGLFTSNMIVENQLSLPFMDPKADKASVNTPEFQKLFNTYKAFFDIVGNKPEKAFTGDDLNPFYQDKNIAMVLSPQSGYGRFENEKDFNWDVVAAPVFADKPGIGFQANTIYYFISNANKKAEQAFLAVTELLSDSAQTISSKEGRPTVLNSEAIRNTLAQESKTKDKNLKALFVNKFAATPVPNTKLAPLVNAPNILNTEFKNMIQNGTDVNTMLRTAEEKINQAIAEAKSK